MPRVAQARPARLPRQDTPHAPATAPWPPSPVWAIKRRLTAAGAPYSSHSRHLGHVLADRFTPVQLADGTTTWAAWPNEDTLSEKTGLSERCVRIHLKALLTGKHALFTRHVHRQKAVPLMLLRGRGKGRVHHSRVVYQAVSGATVLVFPAHQDDTTAPSFAEDWDCPHPTHCGHPASCQERQRLAVAKATHQEQERDKKRGARNVKSEGHGVPPMSFIKDSPTATQQPWGESPRVRDDAASPQPPENSHSQEHGPASALALEGHADLAPEQQLGATLTRWSKPVCVRCGKAGNYDIWHDAKDCPRQPPRMPQDAPTGRDEGHRPSDAPNAV